MNWFCDACLATKTSMQLKLQHIAYKIPTGRINNLSNVTIIVKSTASFPNFVGQVSGDRAETAHARAKLETLSSLQQIPK